MIHQWKRDRRFRRLWRCGRCGRDIQMLKRENKPDGNELVFTDEFINDSHIITTFMNCDEMMVWNALND